LKILSRNLALAGQASARPRVIVASAEDVTRQRFAQAVADTGYEPVPIKSGRDVLRRINAVNDISALVVDSTLPDPGLASFLAQIRADVYARRLPLILIAVPDTAESRALVLKYRAEREQLNQALQQVAGYRKQKLEIEVRYEQDRTRLVQSVVAKPVAEQTAQFQVLEDRLKEQLQELARLFPEGANLDRAAVLIEKRMQVLIDKYSVESQQREGALKRWLEPSATITVASVSLLEDPKKLQFRLQGEDGKTETKPLTEAEQQEYIEKSIAYFARMARGEIKGFELTPFAEIFYNTLRAAKLNEKGQADAIDVVLSLSAARAQEELVFVVLDDKRPLALRVKATDALIKHIQQNSLMLKDDFKARLLKLYADAGAVPEQKDLWTKLAVLLGSMRPDTRSSGERLRDYQPTLPVPPKMNP
jgi:hypothetical protein